MRKRAMEAYSYGGSSYNLGDIVEIPEGARRVRLLAPSFFNNHLSQPGEVIELPAGVEGPHKSKAVSHDKIDYGTDPSIDANRILGDIKLEPLFTEIPHEEVDEHAVPKPMLAIAPPVKS